MASDSGRLLALFHHRMDAIWQSGGVIWGGKVHETGNFGLIHFEPGSPDEMLAMEKRMLRLAWFKFLARSKALAEFWSD